MDSMYVIVKAMLCFFFIIWLNIGAANTCLLSQSWKNIILGAMFFFVIRHFSLKIRQIWGQTFWSAQELHLILMHWWSSAKILAKAKLNIFFEQKKRRSGEDTNENGKHVLFLNEFVKIDYFYPLLFISLVHFFYFKIKILWCHQPHDVTPCYFIAQLAPVLESCFSLQGHFHLPSFWWWFVPWTCHGHDVYPIRRWHWHWWFWQRTSHFDFKKLAWSSWALLQVHVSQADAGLLFQDVQALGLLAPKPCL